MAQNRDRREPPAHLSLSGLVNLMAFTCVPFSFLSAGSCRRVAGYGRQEVWLPTNVARPTLAGRVSFPEVLVRWRTSRRDTCCSSLIGTTSARTSGDSV